jgi:CBS domain-containing protein
MQPAPLLGAADETLATLATRMRAAGERILVVIDPTGAAIGLVDEGLLSRVGFESRAEEPVRSALGLQAPAIIDSALPIYIALSRMQREALARLVVVDEKGHPQGVLHADAILRHPIADLLAALDRISPEEDVASLASAKQAQGKIVAALLERHEPAVSALELINTANFDIARRLTATTVTALQTDGWGPLPVPFTLILMGSAGRGESLLHPDQDNGFILADYQDSDHTRIDGYFIALAERLTRDFATIGFPLCKGGVMATNPLWRKTISQWRAQITGWTQKRSNVAILFADIFFDFRQAYGLPELVVELRRHVTAAVRKNLPFLNQIAWRQMEQPLAVGRFGRLSGDVVDLKLNGMLPLVELVRLLALREGIEDTGTLARLDTLRQTGVLPADDYDRIAEAFGFLIHLQLRRQLTDAAAGRGTGAEIAVSNLSRRQRDQLFESLRSIESLRRRVVGEFIGTTGSMGAG